MGRNSKDLLSQCLGGHRGPALLQRGQLPGRNAQWVPEVKGHEGGQEEWDGDTQDTPTSRLGKPPRLLTSPAPFERSGYFGDSSGTIGGPLMFPGPGNIHTQMLELVITQLQAQPCPIRVGVSRDQSLG